jgi:hypothetical protein
MVSDTAKSISAFLTRKRQSGRVVTATPDFKRILALPRRAPVANALVDGSTQTHAEMWTDVLRLPGCADPWTLNDEQGWSLSEAFTQNGLLADLAVGAGKSLVSFLIPSVLECERPLIVMPANALHKKTATIDFPQAMQRWRLHPNIRFVSYEKLAREKQSEFFERGMYSPIIFDEVHRMKNHKAAVTRRVLRYREKYDWVRCFGMSGTLTSKSLRDYAHLAALCLGDGSPLPLRWLALEDWSDALDEGIEETFRPSPGSLLQFCAEGETARQGFQRRLRETPGYVSVLTSDVRSSLFISESAVETPEVVKAAVRMLRLQNVTPTGEVVPAGLAFRHHIAELNNGYCHSWVWPDNRKDIPWLNARKAWRKLVHWVIKHSGSAAVGGRTFDTENEVALFVDRGGFMPPPGFETARATWLTERARLAGIMREAFHGKTWEPEECITWDVKREPPKKATWISGFMVEHAMKWLASNERAIVWSAQRPFQARMRLEGALVFGGGEDEIVHAEHNCVASIAAHGEGKNLQHAYSRNLLVNIPASGKTTEQLYGRTHRQGQPEDEVSVELVLNHYEAWAAFEQARRHAGYIYETTGRAQKLRYADVDVASKEVVMRRAAQWPRDPLWCYDWSRTQNSHEKEMAELGIVDEVENGA